MSRLLIALGAGAALSGCATVGLEASSPDPGSCTAVKDVAVDQKTFAAFAAPGATSRHLDGAATPFVSPAPSVDAFRDHKLVTQRSLASGNADAVFDLLIRWVPDSDDLRRRSKSSTESATAARDLHTLLNEISPSVVASERLRLALSTSGGSSNANLLTISTKDDVNQKLSRILQAGGDDTLLLYAAADLAMRLANAADMEARSLALDASGMTALQESAANYQAARFLRTYFKAYFRGGKLFQSELKVEEFTSKAMEAIKAKVKLQPKDEKDLNDKLKEVLSGVCKDNGDAGCFLTSLGKEKLITRSGESLQFKGISLSVGYDTKVQATWDYPKTAEFAPQLIRVLIEALFDSMKGRPNAVAASTACSTTPPLFDTGECVSASQTDLAKVIASVDEKASRADSLASVATGQIIRGISVIALNNEALAKSAENLAGVVARKVVERAAWQQSEAGKCTTSAPAVTLKVAKK